MRAITAFPQAIAVIALVFGGVIRPVAAVQPLQRQLSSTSQADVTPNNRHLTAVTQPAFHISSLHTTTLSNSTAATSATASLTGVKPGLPATCYGQPCSASACYPAATVSVRQYVNYINVTAIVELDRQYNVRTQDKRSLLVAALSPLKVVARQLSCAACSFDA